MHDLYARARAVNPRAPLDEIALWFHTKPPFASWFIRGERANLAIGDSRVALTGFRIPAGDVGVLTYFSNAVGAAADFQYVTFAIEIDGAPLNGFASIIGPLSFSTRQPWQMMEPLRGGQRVQVVATNTGATAISNVQGFVAGWYWTLGREAGDAV